MWSTSLLCCVMPFYWLIHFLIAFAGWKESAAHYKHVVKNGESCLAFLSCWRWSIKVVCRQMVLFPRSLCLIFVSALWSSFDANCVFFQFPLFIKSSPFNWYILDAGGETRLTCLTHYNITGRTKAPNNKIGNEEFSCFPTSGDIDLPYIPIWWEFCKPFGFIHVYYKKISLTDFLILINNVRRKSMIVFLINFLFV